MNQTTQIFSEGQSPTLSACINYTIWSRMNFSFATTAIFLISAALAGVILLEASGTFRRDAYFSAST